MLSIINCLLADGRISKCFWSDLWLSRALLWRLSLGFANVRDLGGQIYLKSCSTSLSLLLWNSPFKMPWFTSPGPMMWGWVHSVGCPYLAVALKIALFQRYLANSDLIFVAHTFGRSMQVDSVLRSSLDTWNLKPPSTQSWFTYIPIIVAGGSSLKSFILC